MENSEEMTTQHIEYTRTIVPSTMRSPYWKFFGFPSDSSNNVLTKQKIVCSLCHAVIAYNKNTSNLRTHIVARHPELLIELYNEKNKKNIAMIPTRDEMQESTEPVNKRQKTLYVVSSNESKGDILSHSSYVSTTNETVTGNIKPYREAIIEVNEVIENADDKTDNSDYDDYAGSITHNTEYTFEEIEDNALKVSVPLETTLSNSEQIIEMLITDLLPPSHIEDVGFTKFATDLGISNTSLQKNHIEPQMSKLYNKSFDKIHQELKAITNTMPYSLSIECYQNIENKTMMCIYFNHLVPNEARLQCTAYTTIEATSSIDYGGLLSEFNLSNCSAVIINEENELLEQFLEANGIPIVPCLETVINNCMTSIFSHSSVNSAYKKALELFQKHDCALLEPIPEIYEENAWSKFNFLQFLQDQITIVDEDNNESLEMCKHLVGLLNPLKITLEAIADEPLPICSLMKPFERKLTEEYFSSFYCETEALIEVKNILTNELSQRILNNMFLSEAAFFDPRFQSIIVENENLQEIKNSIANRFEHLLANNIADEKPIKLEAKPTQRKSSLKLFFNRGNDHESKPLQSNMKRSLDYEIMKYTAEAAVDLEQCPMKWWEENEFIFRKLRKISDYYMCVPCCSTSLFKLSLKDRVRVANRRFMLRKNMANQLWFLHFNKDLIVDLKSEEQSKK